VAVIAAIAVGAAIGAAACGALVFFKMRKQASAVAPQDPEAGVLDPKQKGADPVLDDPKQKPPDPVLYRPPSVVASQCPMGAALNWSPYQGGQFRETTGRKLWGDKASEVMANGCNCSKLDVVMWLAVRRQWLDAATVVQGRELIRIIKPEDLAEDPEIAKSDRWLLKRYIKKVYILKEGADLEVDRDSLEALQEHGVLPPENVARFSPDNFQAAWAGVEGHIERSQKLVMHFTSLDAAKLILDKKSLGLRAATSGQGAGGLSVVFYEPSTGAGSGGSAPLGPGM